MKIYCDGGGWDCENPVTELGELVALYQPGGTGPPHNMHNMQVGVARGSYTTRQMEPLFRALIWLGSQPGLATGYVSLSHPLSYLPWWLVPFIFTPLSDPVFSSFAFNTFPSIHAWTCFPCHKGKKKSRDSHSFTSSIKAHPSSILDCYKGCSIPCVSQKFLNTDIEKLIFYTVFCLLKKDPLLPINKFF